MPTVVAASTFPQTDAGRSRAEAIAELQDYTGGSGTKHDAKAGRSWDAAVRFYNATIWKFTRTSQDITLVASTSEYTLDGSFRAPLRAQYVDASGNTREPLFWINPEERLTFIQEGPNSGPAPKRYTIYNQHELGVVRLVGNLGATSTYPTLRVSYFHRIALASGATDRLGVPQDVDEAVFRWALWDLKSKQESVSKLQGEFAVANSMFEQARQTWEGFPDIATLGVGS